MRYLVTLAPLEPYFFGGDTTFGIKGDEKNSSYLVKSRYFPQQSAILGMIKKEIMTQSKTLTRKVRGEWVDKQKKEEAIRLVGNEKFDILEDNPQNFGVIKKIGSVFLIQNNQRYIKKVNIDSFDYDKDKKLLQGYSSKNYIYDNYISLDSDNIKNSKNIFKAIHQIGNSKNDKEDSLFKKTSYKLEDNFKFAFYLECDYELSNSIVTLGGDRSSFKLEVKEDSSNLNYQDRNGYLTLLSDAYITISIKENCDFAITSEISYQSLINKKSSMTKNRDSKKNRQNNPFKKSKKIYLYEKGSIFIGAKSALITNLKNKNLQQVGYNVFS